ncbi:MAG TPA: ABC transporter ATP-binding protein [Candidatus Chromulinivoraceae bacterium]|nr:ABC transporter ATP-binding protein [Candidatus Chromulinivoraceae bacterium]
MNVNRQTLRLYWEQVKKHRTSFIVMLVFIPVGSLLIDTALPYMLSQAIGALTEHHLAKVYPFLWIAAGLGLLGASFNLVGFRSMVYHESKTLANLREQTFIRLIKKDNHFFVNQKIGAMTSRYIDYVRSEVTLQDLFIIRTLGFILSIGSGVAILLTQSWLVAAIVFTLLVMLAFQIRWSAKKRAPWRHERKTLVAEIHGKVADALTNNAIVKAFAGEDREIKDLQKQTRRFERIYRKDIGFTATEGSIRVALMVVVQIIAIVVSVQLVGTGSISLATAVFMLAYLQRIGSQLFTLGDIINGYDQALLDAAPMTEMLSENVHVNDSHAASKLVITNPVIKFDNVSYRYDDAGEDVLRAIQLTIPAGQKVGLVGLSGAGKTTITHLLLRFADVTGGAIHINDADIRDVTQKSLRSAIAYVPQEPMLFHRTLRENIAYGKPDATDDEIREAAIQANALDFIKSLPHGLDTLVGERGVKLSGGQRQRIAIARALLKNAPILVLDEATSALDSESEKLIQDALEKLMKNRTSIVVAHRLSTIATLDRIIVLDKGHIVEDGAHTDLLKQKGIYAKLWAHQSGGFIEE